MSSACWNIHVPPMGGTLESHREKVSERSFLRQRNDKPTRTKRHTEREREGSLAARPPPPSSLCSRYVPRSARPAPLSPPLSLWEGLRHCAAPGCIVWMCICTGCTELFPGFVLPHVSFQCIAASCHSQLVPSPLPCPNTPASLPSHRN